MYGYDSFLFHSSPKDMQDYKDMTTDEIIGICIMRFVVFFAIIGVIAIVCVMIKILS